MSLTQIWGQTEPDWKWEDQKGGGIKKNPRLFRPTDGALWLCIESSERLEPGFDWSGVDGLVRGVCLPYKSMMLRAEDIALAESEGQVVEVKVQVRTPPELSTTTLAEIAGRAYDITRTDSEGRLSYLYMEELKSDGRVSLVESDVTYDELGQAHRTEMDTEITVRSFTASYESGAMTAEVVVRTVDYRGETTLRRGVDSYHVDAVSTEGEWTKLQATQTAHDGKGV